MRINPGPRPIAGNPWGGAATPYEELGGEVPLRALVDHFYDRIKADSPVLQALHPADDRNSRRNLFEYLSGWMGGPNLYAERKGHPRLRARHLRFAIGTTEAAEWMRCMTGAMDDTNIPEPVRGYLEIRFAQLADHMRNRDEA
ncbi:MAG: group II truncated hemoglobin [Acidimicrobiia bacterium]